MLFASLGILELSVLLIAFVLVTFFTEVERFGWATISVLVTLVLAQWLKWTDIHSVLKTHALLSAIYFGGYVVAGVAWSFVKWFSFLMRFRDVLKEVDEPTSEYYQAVTYRGNSLKRKPMAAQNKQKITAWMIFWPFSLIGTVLNDPVKRFFTFLFGRFKHLYQKMADSIFKDVDFDPKPKTKTKPNGPDSDYSNVLDP